MMGVKIRMDQRRTGDRTFIPGDYQYRALREGPCIQRFWHANKLELLDWAFPIGEEDYVVDVGCGSGVFADAMVRRGARVLGVDANADAVRFAATTFGRERCRFVVGLLDELALPEATFHAATCLEIMEHVFPDQVSKLLTDLYRILKPQGRLLVTTPNYRGTWPLVEYLADRVASTAQMDADQHVTRFHKRMLRGCIEDAGFRVEKIQTYCTFAPFMAVLSMRFASWVNRIERKLNLPFGNILVAIAVRD